MSSAPPPVRKIVKRPATAAAAPPSVPTRLSVGGGVTAGLEIWRVGTLLVLYDRSPDNRFANDVERWNTAAGLNAAHALLLKDAAGKDST